LDLYLQLQYVPAPWTIYKSIRKLAPAHYAVYSRAGLQLRKYWDVDYRDKVRISEGDAIDGLEEQIRDAVRLRMIADVPLADGGSGHVASKDLQHGIPGGSIQ
jgi:asparagine synthase (glutamine-hydrolysing)